MSAGNVRFEARMVGLEHLIAALEPKGLYISPVREALEKSALAIEADAKRNVPQDKRDLMRSITHEVSESEARVGTSLKYAPFVHGPIDGGGGRSRPHWPPFGPGSELAQWAARHGIPAFMAAKGISQHGTALVPFLKDAAESCESKIRGFLEEAAQQIGRNWSSR